MALKSIANKQTQTQIVRSVAEQTGLTKVQVDAVLKSLGEHAQRHLMKRGSGEITLPHLGVKLRRVERKARWGRNPATGEKPSFSA